MWNARKRSSPIIPNEPKGKHKGNDTIRGDRCCGNTARINTIGDAMPATFVTKDTAVGALIYVDDIGMAGSKRVIEETGKNLRRIETEKRYTFNIEKTNIMTVGKRKGKEETKVELKKGIVTNTNFWGT